MKLIQLAERKIAIWLIFSTIQATNCDIQRYFLRDKCDGEITVGDDAVILKLNEGKIHKNPCHITVMSREGQALILNVKNRFMRSDVITFNYDVNESSSWQLDTSYVLDTIENEYFTTTNNSSQVDICISSLKNELVTSEFELVARAFKKANERDDCDSTTEFWCEMVKGCIDKKFECDEYDQCGNYADANTCHSLNVWKTFGIGVAGLLIIFIPVAVYICRQRKTPSDKLEGEEVRQQTSVSHEMINRNDHASKTSVSLVVDE